LDQLVTWRELSYHFAERDPQHASFASVPDWARATLAKHAQDARATVYDLATLERAATYDEVWNAAQRQLVRDGRIHNYLRMLWGKRVLEWTASAERAAETLVFLNDKYALDGRDPNSYSGIYWCFGRHDRPWGPERPVFGLVRYMSSDATKRKLRLRAYLERYRE
jgi:deoxyribodipyrimidine photo-lyase